MPLSATCDRSPTRLRLRAIPQGFYAAFRAMDLTRSTRAARGVNPHLSATCRSPPPLPRGQGGRREHRACRSRRPCPSRRSCPRQPESAQLPLPPAHTPSPLRPRAHSLASLSLSLCRSATSLAERRRLAALFREPEPKDAMAAQRARAHGPRVSDGLLLPSPGAHAHPRLRGHPALVAIHPHLLD